MTLGSQRPSFPSAGTGTANVQQRRTFQRYCPVTRPQRKRCISVIFGRRSRGAQTRPNSTTPNDRTLWPGCLVFQPGAERPSGTAGSLGDRESPTLFRRSRESGTDRARGAARAATSKRFWPATRRLAQGWRMERAFIGGRVSCAILPRGRCGQVGPSVVRSSRYAGLETKRPALGAADPNRRSCRFRGQGLPDRLPGGPEGSTAQGADRSAIWRAHGTIHASSLSCPAAPRGDAKAVDVGHPDLRHGTTTQLDRQLHLGHRRRRAARPLRARQVPRRDPADDGAAPPRRRAGADQAGRARHEGLARQGGHRPTRTRRCARPPARPSTTPRSSRCATCRPAPASSSSRPTSRPTSTASRPTCRTSSRTSSSATRSRGSPRPTRSGTLIEKFSRPTSTSSPNPVLERRRLGQAPRPRQPRAWARSSRSWSAASTRRTTRRPASTGRRATR